MCRAIYSYFLMYPNNEVFDYRVSEQLGKKLIKDYK